MANERENPKEEQKPVESEGGEEENEVQGYIMSLDVDQPEEEELQT